MTIAATKNCVKYCFILIICLGIFSRLSAQFNVTVRLVSLPVTHQTDTIFIAGNFNDWQPGKKEYTFSRLNGQLTTIIKNLPAGMMEFKCTRGSWQKTACAINGADLQNNIIQLTSDTTIDTSIPAWKDDFDGEGKKHTASPNVQILDTAFEIPQLKRTRRIWIYLPDGYSAGNAKYPVLYMQDGQNIFDDYTAYASEWNVDETLDSLIKDGAPPCIVVGIDNGPQRMREYNPYTFSKFGKGEGKQYVDFLVKTLKPFIDKHFRTLTSQKNTLIAGSSMGGLISYYAMLKYPDVFGKAGIFSPSFWIANKIKALTDTAGNKINGRLFFYIGALEGDVNVKNMDEVVQKLHAHSKAIVYSVVDPQGQHNEQAWRTWFVDFYKWIMADAVEGQ